MTIINSLPFILASHSEYSFKLSEVQRPSLTVTFQITLGSAIRTHNVQYHMQNGSATIHLGSILKSIFTKAQDPFLYEETVEFTSADDYLVADLKIYIEEEIIDFRVINAALQSDDEFRFLEFNRNDNPWGRKEIKNQRLGEYSKMPRFNGYPMSTSVMSSNGISRVLNSRGCPFDDTQIDSTVHIKLTKPDGTIVETDNVQNLLIPDEESANGLYHVEYTTESGLVEIREFQVVNAGVGKPLEEIDMRFMRQTEDVGNEYAFVYQSFHDTIRVEAVLSFAPNATTRYKYGIRDMAGNTYENQFSTANSISINPYLTESNQNTFVPQNEQFHTVDLWVIHDGQEYHVQEQFNILSIQPQEPQQVNGAIIIVKDHQNIYMPLEIMGDDIPVEQLSSYRYKAFVGLITPESDVVWELTDPHSFTQTITGDEVFISSAVADPNYFAVTQSGNYQLTATFMYQGVEQTLVRNININYIPLFQ